MGNLIAQSGRDWKNACNLYMVLTDSLSRALEISQDWGLKQESLDYKMRSSGMDLMTSLTKGNYFSILLTLLKGCENVSIMATHNIESGRN